MCASHMPHLPLADANYDAVFFDLDGVLTDTARIHAKAWKRMFDAYLLKRGAARNEKYQPFESESDYLQYVDGKPRYDGVQSFLEALGNQKDLFVNEILEADGVFVFPGSRRWAQALRRTGKKLAVVSSSNNCQAVLRSAQIEDLFDGAGDGRNAAELSLPGKPAPDMFLEAARELGVEPRRTVVGEKAISVVQPGGAGRF